jgi:hypothetical protein
MRSERIGRLQNRGATAYHSNMQHCEIHASGVHIGIGDDVIPAQHQHCASVIIGISYLRNRHRHNWARKGRWLEVPTRLLCEVVEGRGSSRYVRVLAAK